MGTSRTFVAIALLALAACAEEEPKPPGWVKANMPMPPVQGRTAPDKYDTPPHLISGNAPVYPVTQILNGLDGEARLSFTITEDGTTKDIVVESATYRYFGIHAVIAVKGWRFQPAIKDGIPMSVRVNETFKFSIPR